MIENLSKGFSWINCLHFFFLNHSLTLVLINCPCHEVHSPHHSLKCLLLCMTEETIAHRGDFLKQALIAHEAEQCSWQADLSLQLTQHLSLWRRL